MKYIVKMSITIGFLVAINQLANYYQNYYIAQYAIEQMNASSGSINKLYIISTFMNYKYIFYILFFVIVNIDGILNVTDIF